MKAPKLSSNVPVHDIDGWSFSNSNYCKQPETRVLY